MGTEGCQAQGNGCGGILEAPSGAGHTALFAEHQVHPCACMEGFSAAGPGSELLLQPRVKWPWAFFSDELLNLGLEILRKGSFFKEKRQGHHVMSNATPDFAFLGLLNKCDSLVPSNQRLGPGRSQELFWGGKLGLGGKFCRSYKAQSNRFRTAL